MIFSLAGSYNWGDTAGGLWARVENYDIEILLGDESGTKVVAAYKTLGTQEFAFGSMLGKEIYGWIKKLSKQCKEKKCSPALATYIGTVKRYDIKTKSYTATFDKKDGYFCGVEFNGDKSFSLVSTMVFQMPTIQYTQLKTLTFDSLQASKKSDADNDEDGLNVEVRSLEEIALTGKDITWVNSKKYYVITDDQQAELLIDALERYEGLIVCDYETTGLRINRFGEIGSPAKEKVDRINKENKEKGLNQYRVDKLVGLIFCVEEDVGYYLPMMNRKFRNLYGKDSAIRSKVVERIKADFTIGRHKDDTSYTAQYIRQCAESEFTSDLILMARVKYILENKPMGAHHGSFEYKCSLMYGIDLNLQEDSMILHQLMYKFRGSRSSRGNKSDLKTLTYKEFGVDQLDLYDFFVGFKEEADKGFSSGAGGKKKKAYIDFSYMSYEGTKAYGPADGDFSYKLIKKYKNDLINDFSPKLKYLYEVEIVVACAIGYMEFHGHRIDENKIRFAEVDTIAEQLSYERKIRDLINFNSPDEIEMFERVEALRKESAELLEDKSLSRERTNEFISRAKDILAKVREKLEESANPLNLNAVAQVAMVMYDMQGVPLPKEGGRTVQKRALKPYKDAKDKDGNIKYPAVGLYLSWKNSSTLLSKFFGALQDFMYPDGFIFSNYGQIATATGRMSCSRPNAQQYPKAITKMVIPREDAVFADADYSQIEYRTMVAIAQETELLAEFRDPDMDYHTKMASLMFGVPYAEVTSDMRSDAKTFNFGIPYGMGDKKLAFQLLGREDKEAEEEAKRKKEMYFAGQPRVRALFESIKENASVTRFTSTNWDRRREYIFTDEDGNPSDKLKNSALRQAGNAVIQGTAADIYKIGVARFFTFIRQNNLLGKVIITNMIHDEQLVEIDYKRCDVEAVLAHLIECMELVLEGFPPLYVGAGIGKTWADAKGKYAEIHPLLGREILQENIHNSLKARPEAFDDNYTLDTVVKRFERRNYYFREKKIMDYVLDRNNHRQTLHPIIAATLKLQFEGGLEKGLYAQIKADAKEGKEWTKQEISVAEAELDLKRLEKFIEERDLGVPIDLFKGPLAEHSDTEIDEDYDDDDEEFLSDNYGELADYEFRLIDESQVFGCRLEDIIREFKLIVSEEQGLCGVCTKGMTRAKVKSISAYLANHAVDKEEPGALRVAYLQEGDLLRYLDVYVQGIKTEDLIELAY